MSEKGSKSWMGRSKLEKQKAGDETATATPAAQQSRISSLQQPTQTNAQWVITIKIIGENNVREQISTSTTRFMADAT